MTSLNLEARILYRDGLMLIIDKPPGVPVHSGPGGGDNLELHFDQLRFGLPHPPALAHRLDRDTSGCLILGRHRKALSRLGRLFTAGTVGKTYWAVVEGVPKEPEGRIEVALRKITDKSGWRMVIDPDGQAAATNYRVMGSDGKLSWLELKPETGRTHQIRVHCAALGHPILGEPMYGTHKPDVPLHLLARALSVPLYPKKPAIEVTAAPPPHMLAALKSCGYEA